MRALAAHGAISVALLLSLACDKAADTKKADADADKTADAKKAGDEDPADKDPGDKEPAANFADPQTEPPPAPEGTVLMAKPWLYVQTCAEPHTCPDLLQPEGDKHCRELKLGGHVNWRLPDKKEVERMGSVEGLEAREGYHWTRSPDEENMNMAWIVDFAAPDVGMPTTIPRDRKPFRIRCVKEP